MITTANLWRSVTPQMLKVSTSCTRNSYVSIPVDLDEVNYRKRAEIANNPYGDLLRPNQTKRPITRRERYIEAIRNIPKPRIGSGETSKDQVILDSKTKKRRNVFYRKLTTVKTFSQLGIRSTLCSRIATYNVVKPTDVQADIIPVILKRKNCLFIAPTGSGKTYSYLLPLVENLLADNSEGYVTRVRTPRAIILSPSLELSYQMEAVANHLVEADARIHILENKAESDKIISNSPIDILIGDSSKIRYLYQNGFLSIEDLKYVVIDEIDIFMDYRSLDQNLAFIRELVTQDVEAERPDTVRTQIIMCGAVLPQHNCKQLSSVIPEFSQYLDTSSHVPPAHLQQEFWFVRTQNKPSHILELLRRHIRNQKLQYERPLIFCNFANTATWLHNYLIDNHIENFCITKETRRHDRKRILTRGIPETEYPVVGTDILGVGLDLRHFSLVVNFELPFTYQDYIRRIGRVARLCTVSDTCRAISYVSKEKDKSLYNIIQDTTLARSCSSQVLVKPNKRSPWMANSSN